jgi:hypothetical protein
MNTEPNEENGDPAGEVTSAARAQPDNPEPVKDCCSAHDKWKHRLEWGNFVVGSLTLIAVVWYACIASKQWGEMRVANQTARTALESSNVSSEKSLVLAEKSLRISQRAYIAPQSPKADFERNRVLVNLHNVGKTPARNVRAHVVQIRVLGNTVSPNTAGQAFLPTNEDLFPGIPIVVNVTLVAFSPGELTLIRERKVSLTVAGVIFYDDGFGYEDRASFCSTYEPGPPENWGFCPERK